jgi:hypothetical protein
MFKELKEDIQKQLNESQENQEDTETKWTQRGFKQTSEWNQAYYYY